MCHPRVASNVENFPGLARARSYRGFNYTRAFRVRRRTSETERARDDTPELSHAAWSHECAKKGVAHGALTWINGNGPVSVGAVRWRCVRRAYRNRNYLYRGGAPPLPPAKRYGNEVKSSSAPPCRVARSAENRRGNRGGARWETKKRNETCGEDDIMKDRRARVRCVSMTILVARRGY